MSTVIADVGAANANSYVTVAEADSYFGDSFGKGQWTSATPDQKAALVITASRTLDQYILWVGQKTTDSQSMEWPRFGAYDRFGKLYANDVIPTVVKYATFELAYYMLENGGLSFAEQTIDSVKVGSIEVDFTERSTDSGIPKFIENMIGNLGSPIIVGNNAVQNVRLERV